MDMRKVIDVYAAATEHVDQGLSLTLFMRSDIPKGLCEWKTENKQTTRDLSILRNYAFNKGPGVSRQGQRFHGQRFSPQTPAAE